MSTEQSSGGAGATPSSRGHLHHPLRGLASEGAEDAVREALRDLPGIFAVQVSSGMAIAEVLFDEALVTADEVRARLERAGVRRPKHGPQGAP